MYLLEKGNNYNNKIKKKIVYHSGNTDFSGGHYDKNNYNKLGPYHYHHRLPAHHHPDGVCPDNPNVLPCNFSLEEICNTSNYFAPLLVYESAKKPGFNVNGNIAEDMLCGSFSLEMLKSQKGITEVQIDACKNNDSELLFNQFTGLIKNTSMGEMQDVALDMLNHFKCKNGETYENNTFTKNVRKHNTTRTYVHLSSNIARNYISKHNKYISNINSDTKSEFEKLIRPKFNDLYDTLAGFQITLNDTWGLYIELNEIVYCNRFKRFKGVLNYIIYDHFGLDVNDVEKFGNRHSGFGAWFCLQHYSGFNRNFGHVLQELNPEKTHPKSITLIASPITMSCIISDLEKHIVLRQSLLTLVLKVRFFRSMV